MPCKSALAVDTPNLPITLACPFMPEAIRFSRWPSCARSLRQRIIYRRTMRCGIPEYTHRSAGAESLVLIRPLNDGTFDFGSYHASISSSANNSCWSDSSYHGFSSTFFNICR